MGVVTMSRGGSVVTMSPMGGGGGRCCDHVPDGRGRGGWVL